jgi:hypothetical protein
VYAEENRVNQSSHFCLSRKDHRFPLLNFIEFHVLMLYLDNREHAIVKWLGISPDDLLWPQSTSLERPWVELAAA